MDRKFKWDYDLSYRKRLSAVGRALVRGDRSAAKAAAEAAAEATAKAAEASSTEAPSTWEQVDAIINRA